jgi:hypothetical protein
LKAHGAPGQKACHQAHCDPRLGPDELDPGRQASSRDRNYPVITRVPLRAVQLPQAMISLLLSGSLLIRPAVSSLLVPGRAHDISDEEDTHEKNTPAPKIRGRA